MQNKIWVIMELEGVWLTHNYLRSRRTTFGHQNKIKFDEKDNNFEYYFRSGREDFLDIIFNKNMNFELGIWSSCNKDYIKNISEIYFKKYYKELNFITVTQNKKKELENIKPISIEKNLNYFYQNNDDFGLHNTLVISNYSNLLDQFTYNDLLLPVFDYKNNIEEDYNLLYLIKYLRGIDELTKNNKIKDIRDILQYKRFDTFSKKLASSLYNFKNY